MAAGKPGDFTNLKIDSNTLSGPYNVSVDCSNLTTGTVISDTTGDVTFGYTCPSCGQWVGLNDYHVCPMPQIRWPVQYDRRWENGMDRSIQCPQCKRQLKKDWLVYWQDREIKCWKCYDKTRPFERGQVRYSEIDKTVLCFYFGDFLQGLRHLGLHRLPRWAALELLHLEKDQHKLEGGDEEVTKQCKTVYMAIVAELDDEGGVQEIVLPIQFVVARSDEEASTQVLVKNAEALKPHAEKNLKVMVRPF